MSNANYYNKLYELTGDERFAQAAKDAEFNEQRQAILDRVKRENKGQEKYTDPDLLTSFARTIGKSATSSGPMLAPGIATALGAPGLAVGGLFAAGLANEYFDRPIAKAYNSLMGEEQEAPMTAWEKAQNALLMAAPMSPLRAGQYLGGIVGAKGAYDMTNAASENLEQATGEKPTLLEAFAQATAGPTMRGLGGGDPAGMIMNAQGIAQGLTTPAVVTQTARGLFGLPKNVDAINNPSLKNRLPAGNTGFLSKFFNVEEPTNRVKTANTSGLDGFQKLDPDTRLDASEGITTDGEMAKTVDKSTVAVDEGAVLEHWKRNAAWETDGYTVDPRGKTIGEFMDEVYAHELQHLRSPNDGTVEPKVHEQNTQSAAEQMVKNRDIWGKVAPLPDFPPPPFPSEAPYNPSPLISFGREADSPPLVPPGPTKYLNPPIPLRSEKTLAGERAQGHLKALLEQDSLIASREEGRKQAMLESLTRQDDQFNLENSVNVLKNVIRQKNTKGAEAVRADMEGRAAEEAARKQYLAKLQHDIIKRTEQGRFNEPEGTIPLLEGDARFARQEPVTSLQPKTGPTQKRTWADFISPSGEVMAPITKPPKRPPVDPRTVDRPRPEKSTEVMIKPRRGEHPYEVLTLDEINSNPSTPDRRIKSVKPIPENYSFNRYQQETGRTKAQYKQDLKDGKYMVEIGQPPKRGLDALMRGTGDVRANVMAMNEKELLIAEKRMGSRYSIESGDTSETSAMSGLPELTRHEKLIEAITKNPDKILSKNIAILTETGEPHWNTIGAEGVNPSVDSDVMNVLNDGNNVVMEGNPATGKVILNTLDAASSRTNQGLVDSDNIRGRFIVYVGKKNTNAWPLNDKNIIKNADGDFVLKTHPNVEIIRENLLHNDIQRSPQTNEVTILKGGDLIKTKRARETDVKRVYRGGAFLDEVHMPPMSGRMTPEQKNAYRKRHKGITDQQIPVRFLGAQKLDKMLPQDKVALAMIKNVIKPEANKPENISALKAESHRFDKYALVQPKETADTELQWNKNIKASSEDLSSTKLRDSQEKQLIEVRRQSELVKEAASLSEVDPEAFGWTKDGDVLRQMKQSELDSRGLEPVSIKEIEQHLQNLQGIKTLEIETETGPATVKSVAYGEDLNVTSSPRTGSAVESINTNMDRMQTAATMRDGKSPEKSLMALTYAIMKSGKAMSPEVKNNMREQIFEAIDAVGSKADGDAVMAHLEELVYLNSKLGKNTWAKSYEDSLVKKYTKLVAPDKATKKTLEAIKKRAAGETLELTELEAREMTESVIKKIIPDHDQRHTTEYMRAPKDNELFYRGLKFISNLASGIHRALRPVMPTNQAILSMLDEAINNNSTIMTKSAAHAARKVYDILRYHFEKATTREVDLTHKFNEIDISTKLNAVPKSSPIWTNAANIKNGVYKWEKPMTAPEKAFLDAWKKLDEVSADALKELIPNFQALQNYATQMLRSDWADQKALRGLGDVGIRAARVILKRRLRIVDPNESLIGLDMTKYINGRDEILNPVIEKTAKEIEGMHKVVMDENALHFKDPAELRRVVDGIFLNAIDSHMGKMRDSTGPGMVDLIPSLAKQRALKTYGSAAEQNPLNLLLRQTQTVYKFHTNYQLARTLDKAFRGERVKALRTIMGDAEFTKAQKQVDTMMQNEFSAGMDPQTGRPSKFSEYWDWFAGTETAREPFPNQSAATSLAGAMYKNLLTHPGFFALNSTDAFIKGAMESRSLADLARHGRLTMKLTADFYHNAITSGKGRLYKLASEYAPMTWEVLTELGGTGHYNAKTDKGVLANLMRKGGSTGEKLYEGGGKLWHKLTSRIEAQEFLNNKIIWANELEKILDKDMIARERPDTLKKQYGSWIEAINAGALDPIKEFRKERFAGYAQKAAFEVKRIQGSRGNITGKSAVAHEFTKTWGKNSEAMVVYTLAKMFTNYPTTIILNLTKNMAQASNAAFTKYKNGKASPLQASMEAVSPVGALIAMSTLAYGIIPSAITGKAPTMDDIEKAATKDIGYKNQLMPLSLAGDIARLFTTDIIDVAQGNIPQGGAGLAKKLFPFINSAGKLKNLGEKFSGGKEE